MNWKGLKAAEDKLEAIMKRKHSSFIIVTGD